MRFTLRNLGRLQEATIDLSKDLILLTGPNNTSKTYVAHAIYGFYKFFDHRMQHALWGKGLEGRSVGELILLVQDVLCDIVSEYVKELPDVFATEDWFVSQTSASFDGIPEISEIFLKERLANVGDPTLIINIFLEYFSSYRSPHVLTAERAAIQLFSHELSLKRVELVDSLLKATQRRERVLDPLALLKQARRYPLPVRDSLRVADDLAAMKKLSSPFAPFADRLEQETLQGALRVDEDGALRFLPEQAERAIALHLSSSSVKALASLTLYLRHLAQKGQFLIIDEPELNLHPDNQRRVARLLARLSRSGIKVMVSTHSDYIIREINNLIMLSSDQSGALHAKYGYAEDETLTPERVGAYLFGPTSAQPLPIEPSGFSVKTIDEEIHRLNTSSQDIYFELFGGKP